MKSIQFKLALTAGLTLVLLAGCGNSSASSDSSSDGGSSSSTAQFSFAAMLTKSLAAGGGGADSGPIVSVADYNGDGKGDFAILNRAPGSVSVFLSTGGDFANEQLLSAATAPLAINSGDLNGDGLADLVVITASSASFLYNNGSGGFSPAVEVSLGTANSLLACADFDGDGHQDLAVTDSNGVHLLFGDGGSDPTTYTRIDYTATSGALQNPQAVVVGDVDSDGRADLVFANGSAASLAIWYNHGNDRAGLFGSGDASNAGLALPTGTSARGVACADFNGDGLLDIACSGATANSDGFVEVFLHGSNGFVASAAQEASPDQQTLAVGDFNLDGLSDLAALSRVGANTTGNGEVDFFLGDGGGGLYAQLSYSLGARATAIAAQDFTADGEPDLVVAGNGSAYVLLNTSTR